MTEIEFTEDEIAEMAWGYQIPYEIRAKFVAALPNDPRPNPGEAAATKEEAS